MWELDRKEGWVLKNWCYWTAVLEKTLESSLDCYKIHIVNPKGNQPWIFIGRTDAEAEASTLWLHDAKSWLIRKDWMLGKIEGGGEGDDRGWDGWMASLIQGTWVWANSRRQWRTGKLGMLQSMESQIVGQELVTEQQTTNNSTESKYGSVMKWKGQIFVVAILVLICTSTLPQMHAFKHTLSEILARKIQWIVITPRASQVGQW